MRDPTTRPGGQAAHTPTPPAQQPGSLNEHSEHLYQATWLDIHTEKALLGALLLQPAQLAQVEGWLRATDFFRPQHQLIFQAISELVPATPNITTTDLAMAIHRRLTSRGVYGSYLHDLMQACPQPRNAIYYGHMLLQADARRAIALYTLRLAQTIDIVVQGRGPLPDVLTAATGLDQVARLLTARIRATDPPLHAEMPALARITPSPERISQDDRLLALMINLPNRIPQVRPLLDASDFSTPHAGQLYDLLWSMHISGTPIDILTVMWAGHRAHLLDGSDTASEHFHQRFHRPPPNDISILADDIITLATEIQHAATLDHASALTTSLIAGLTDHSIPVDQLLHLAGSQVHALHQRHQRHQRHTAAYQPPGEQVSSSHADRTTTSI
jgi:replicative DNA helicase